MNLFTNRLATPAPRTPASRPARARLAGALAGAAVLASGLLAGPAAADPVASARAQAAQVAARLSALDAQMARLDEQLDVANSRLAGLNQQLAAARTAYAAAQAKVAADKAALRDQAVIAYLQGGSMSGVQQLMESDAQAAALRQSYMSSVADSEQNAIDGFHSALLQLQAQQARLSAAQAAAQAAVDQVQSARNASAAAAAAEQAQLAAVKGHLADLVAQAQAQRAAAVAQRFSGAAASRGGDWSGAPLPPPGHGAGTAVRWAQAEIGKPYVYGAAGPDSFDCSGLTMYVWGKAGVGLPHSAAGQWDDTTRVPVSELQPGDLVFYYQPVDHVGIYVGGGEMIVADHTGTDVRYASIFRDGLDGGGRVNG